MKKERNKTFELLFYPCKNSNNHLLFVSLVSAYKLYLCEKVPSLLLISGHSSSLYLGPEEEVDLDARSE